MSLHVIFQQARTNNGSLVIGLFVHSCVCWITQKELKLSRQPIKERGRLLGGK